MELLRGFRWGWGGGGSLYYKQLFDFQKEENRGAGWWGGGFGICLWGRWKKDGAFSPFLFLSN